MADLGQGNTLRQLQAPVSSPMRRMAEEYVFDTEVDAYVRFYAPFVPPALPDVANHESVVVVEGRLQRLDQIALEFYQDEALWWVIALRNGLDLPDNEMYPGQTLYVPAADYVRRTILGGR
jgi:nucleoid-associated protein YgaU